MTHTHIYIFELTNVGRVNIKMTTILSWFPKSRNSRRIFKENTDFLNNLHNNNPPGSIVQAVKKLSETLNDTKIGKASVHDFITNDIGFTFKKTAFCNMKRNDNETIKERSWWVFAVKRNKFELLEEIALLSSNQSFIFTWSVAVLRFQKAKL